MNSFHYDENWWFNVLDTVDRENYQDVERKPSGAIV